MKSLVAFAIFASAVIILGYGLQRYQTDAVLEPVPVEAGYTWEFLQEGEDESLSAPLTRVTLVSGGERYDAGLYLGTCAPVENLPSGLLAGEKTGVLCWFAGGGSEIGLFEEAGRTVVKVGSVDEGSAEISGFRGDFRTLFDVGPGARMGRVEARVGEEKGALDVAISPLSVLEDSRCPADAQCIQAGTVRIKARVTGGLGTGDAELTLGQTFATEAEEITLSEVHPAPSSDSSIGTQDYRFVFTVAKR